jgi:hypothetical protein
MKTNTTPIENLSVKAPEGSKCQTKLAKALQEIKDALSGKKIFTF